MFHEKTFKASLLAAAIASSLTTNTFANDLALEEVVVTAQKREQSIQDVPIAVQAIGADMLEQNTVTGISDIGNMTPGLSIGNSVQDGAEIAIRGIGTAVLGLGFDQSVPLYLDGVYLGRGFDLIGDLMDVQQIEVLKGPQGTLFGRNAAAGAINITTKAPHEETEGKIKIGAGAKDLNTVQALFNTALSDNVYLRVNGSMRKRDGWQKDLDGGDDLYEQDQTSARAKLLWDASDTLSVEFTADYSKVDNLQGGYIINKATPGIATQDIDSGSARSTIGLLNGSVPKAFTKRDSQGYSVKVNWDLSDEMTFTSITSYRSGDTDMQLGQATPVVAGLGGANALVDKFMITTDEYSQEFRLSGSNDTADWFAGLNYYYSEGTTEEPVALPAFAALGAAGLQGSFFDDNQGSEITTDSYSLFSDVIWHLSDNLNLTTGLRYSYDKKTSEFVAVNQRAATFFAAVPGSFAGNPTKDTTDWDDVSGRIVLDYQTDAGTLYYAGISQGYKSGGYGTTIGPALAAAGQAFKPFDKETTTNYEAGIKASLMDDRIRLNASVFFTEFENYQLQIADLQNPGSTLDLSAPEAESHGVDLEIVFAAAEGLTLNLAMGYLETEFAKDVTADNGATAIPKGQDLLRAPRWTTTAGLDYVMPFDSGDLRFNTNYTYRTSQRLTNSPAASLTSATIAVAGDPGITITESDNESGAYGLLNARLSFLSADEKWEVGLWGTNLTNTAYRDDDSNAVSNAVLGAVSGQTAAAAAAMVPGAVPVPMALTAYTRNEPRMWGVDFSYNF